MVDGRWHTGAFAGLPSTLYRLLPLERHSFRAEATIASAQLQVHGKPAADLRIRAGVAKRLAASDVGHEAFSSGRKQRLRRAKHRLHARLQAMQGRGMELRDSGLAYAEARGDLLHA